MDVAPIGLGGQALGLLPWMRWQPLLRAVPVPGLCLTDCLDTLKTFILRAHFSHPDPEPGPATPDSHGKSHQTSAVGGLRLSRVSTWWASEEPSIPTGPQNFRTLWFATPALPRGAQPRDRTSAVFLDFLSIPCCE